MDQEQRIAALEAKVRDLTQLLQESKTSDRVAREYEATTSRRGMLKLAGAAAVGAVAATAGGVGLAAADNGLTVVAGNTNSAVPTRVTYSGTSSTETSFVFDAFGYLDNTSFFPAALAGWTGSAANKPASGVYGYTLNPVGFGVIGDNDAGGTGVMGVGGTGVTGRGSGYGLAATQSGAASLFLRTVNDGGPKAAPPVRSDAHVVGEIDTDSNGDLWYCTVSGTPGVWRKIAGPSTAGAFHGISPSRVYDSRSPAPAPGLLATGSGRLVSVADKRDLSTGAVATANVVPVGATAISVNVTVTGTVGTGFLTVNEGGNTVIAASAIYWFGPDQNTANSIIVPVNSARQVTVIAGGGGSTHFILDVSGYYL